MVNIPASSPAAKNGSSPVVSPQPETVNRIPETSSPSVASVASVASVPPLHALFPPSRRVYITGSRADLRVPMREIPLTPTKRPDGAVEANEPVRVYDTSGPWGDSDFHGDVEHGLPAVRAAWIRERGMSRKSPVVATKPATMVIFRKFTPRARACARIRASSPSSTAATAPSCAPSRAKSSASSTTRARVSSRPRWNTSPSAKIRNSSRRVARRLA